MYVVFSFGLQTNYAQPLSQYATMVGAKLRVMNRSVGVAHTTT